MASVLEIICFSGFVFMLVQSIDAQSSSNETITEIVGANETTASTTLLTSTLPEESHVASESTITEDGPTTPVPVSWTLDTRTVETTSPFSSSSPQVQHVSVNASTNGQTIANAGQEQTTPSSSSSNEEIVPSTSVISTTGDTTEPSEMLGTRTESTITTWTKMIQSTTGSTSTRTGSSTQTTEPQATSTVKSSSSLQRQTSALPSSVTQSQHNSDTWITSNTEKLVTTTATLQGVSNTEQSTSETVPSTTERITTTGTGKRVDKKIHTKELMEISLEQQLNAVTILIRDSPYNANEWLEEKSADFITFLMQAIRKDETPSHASSTNLTKRSVNAFRAEQNISSIDMVFVAPTPIVFEDQLLITFFIENNTCKELNCPVKLDKIYNALTTNIVYFNKIFEGKIVGIFRGIFKALYTSTPAAESSSSNIVDFWRESLKYNRVILFGVFLCLLINVCVIIYVLCRARRRKYRLDTICKSSLYKPSEISADIEGCGFDLNSDKDCMKGESFKARLPKNNDGTSGTHMYNLHEYQSWATPLDDRNSRVSATNAGTGEKTKC